MAEEDGVTPLARAPFTSVMTPTLNRLPSSDVVVMRPCTSDDESMLAASHAFSAVPPNRSAPTQAVTNVGLNASTPQAAMPARIRWSVSSDDTTLVTRAARRPLALQLRQADQGAVGHDPRELRRHGRDFGRARVDRHPLAGSRDR